MVSMHVFDWDSHDIMWYSLYDGIQMVYNGICFDHLIPLFHGFNIYQEDWGGGVQRPAEGDRIWCMLMNGSKDGKNGIGEF